MHEDHRKRLRKKFMTCPETLAKHELLELLLTFCIPRKNTNIVAHELLDKFGTISSVINSDGPSLKSINGLGEISVIFFKILRTIFRICLEEKSVFNTRSKNKKLTLNDVLNIMFIKFFGRNEEYVAAALFNSKKEIVFCDFIEKGSQSFVEISFKTLVSLVLKYDAKYVILAHNHPSTIALPSKEDIEITKQIDNLLDTLGVILLDHLIICEDSHVSLFESGIIGNNTNNKKAAPGSISKTLKKTG